jgi:predicted porin
VKTSGHRPWVIGTEVWFGTFYTGSLTEWEQTISYTTPGGHLQLAFLMEDVFGYLPQGDFIERLFQLQAVYAFTPDLILSCYAQYDNDSNNLCVNSRLRWTIRPGTDFYVVWNHGWMHPFDEDHWSALEPVNDQAVVKLRYTWRS